MEKTVSNLLLSRIRRQRADQAADGDRASSRAKLTPVLREADFSDFEEVDKLNRRLGQGPDSLENWLRLWRDNPAISGLKAPARIGWVLEDAGRIVGFLGSIPLWYEFNQVPVLAAATCRFAVEPAYRPFSHLLVMVFFRQKEFELFIDSSATPEAGQIMAAIKAQPLPQKGYDTVLLWVLNSRRYSAYALRKAFGERFWIPWGSRFGQLALAINSVCQNLRNAATPKGFELKEENLARLDRSFDEFVISALADQRGLRAKRTPEILRWHFEPPQNRRPAVLLTCSYEGQLRGYLVLRLYEENEDGLKRSVVADLIAKDNDKNVIKALFRAAFHKARSSGADALEITGFPENVRCCLLAQRPYKRRLPACPFYFKSTSKALNESLRSESAWYACSYDGDSTLWP